MNIQLICVVSEKTYTAKNGKEYHYKNYWLRSGTLLQSINPNTFGGKGKNLLYLFPKMNLSEEDFKMYRGQIGDSEFIED